MAYHLEGKDIVINGFENGIADTPYNGVADMRNVEIVSIPGEASVEPLLTAVVQPPVAAAIAFTSTASTDRIAIASMTGWYEGVAFYLNTSTSTGLSINTLYYARNIVGLTFQPTLAPASTTAVNFSTDGSGTLTTYAYSGQGSPVAYYVDKTGGLAGSNATYVTDTHNYLWGILTEAQGSVPANTLIFMGNAGVTQFTSTNGIVVWNGYFLLWTFQGIDYADTGDLWITGPTSAWVYNWEIVDVNSYNSRVHVLVSYEDGNVYWITRDGLGSIIETPGDTFDPTDSNSYTITDAALLLPEGDDSTCIAELGGVLLIGGRNAFVYVWNKVDPGFTSLLNIPEAFTANIVATSQNAYVFAGVRGRIYITNGSGIDLYKKFPDYLTGVQSPFYRWQDANFGRNQLYFALTATDMSGTVITTLGGLWAIDLETDALRMINKTTNTGYAATVRMVADRPSSNSGVPAFGVRGNGLQLGWYNGSTVGLDVATVGTPYSGYESYIQTEMIPVGTFLDPFTPSQFEWKTSAPLVSGEGVRISYRENITASFTQIGESLTAGAISDLYQTNFQKVQWAQFLIELKSTASTPSYTRLTEVRIRDWPSGTNNRDK